MRSRFVIAAFAPALLLIGCGQVQNGAPSSAPSPNATPSRGTPPAEVRFGRFTDSVVMLPSHGAEPAQKLLPAPSSALAGISRSQVWTECLRGLCTDANASRADVALAVFDGGKPNPIQSRLVWAIVLYNADIPDYGPPALDGQPRSQMKGTAFVMYDALSGDFLGYQTGPEPPPGTLAAE